jgi:ceramide glucosyltransferase
VAAASLLLLCVLGGSLVYCILMVVAARSYLAQPRRSDGAGPISVLKPLSGADEGLEANLRSFFEQQYSEFELLCAVRHKSDPAVAIVESLQHEFPHVACRLIVTGEPPYANAKVFSLSRMLAAARYDLIVMSDSDIRVAPGMLASIAAEFADPKIALATCPYRAIAGRSIWSRLEAEGMNTEFLGGLLVARMLLGVDFAVGPTIVARRSVLDAVQFERLKEYLAEDFVMGKIAAEAGFRVILSRTIVDHRIGSQNLRTNMSHRLRWARSTRRSRPLGYIGQLFTNPIPIALLLCAVHLAWWPALVPTLALRAIAAWAVSQWVLDARVRWHLLFVQDLLSWIFWVAGFFGNTIVWRGRRYYLHRDGRFEPT